MNNNNYTTEIYFFVDELLKTLEKTELWEKLPKWNPNKSGMKKKMSLSEIITLNIIRVLSHFKDLKAFHKNAYQYMRDYFPKMTNYENFLKASNQSFQFFGILRGIFYDQEYIIYAIITVTIAFIFYNYFSKNKNIAIDLNYATMEVWKMMLGCDKKKATQLASGYGGYSSLEDLSLNGEEKLALAKFQTSYFEPYLDVVYDVQGSERKAMEIIQKRKSAMIIASTKRTI